MTKKLLRKSANFAPSLLSAVPNAVKIGAGVGGGIGLLQGAGIFESDAEKKATNVGNRLGKVLTSSTVGAGLGAGAGYGVNRYKANLARNQELEELAAWQRANPKVVGVSVKPIKDAVDSVGNAVTTTKESIRKAVAPTTDEQIATMRAEQAVAANPETKPSLLSWVKSKAEEGVQQRKSLLGFNKMIRKSANFQDPATIQRLIQHGSTYIPQNNTGIVSLESTLRGKMQKKKAKEPRLPASMGVKEINLMIESGKPVGKYFNKEIRKSANFLKRQQQAEFGMINDALVGAGKLITQPAAKVVRKAAKGAGASWTTKLASMNPFGNRDGAKATLGISKGLHGAADYLGTDQAAKLAAIGVGGTALAGGGLLAAKAMQKDEARYNKNIRKSANFNMEFLPDIDYKGLSHLGITAGGALAGGLAGRAFSGKEILMEPKIKQQHDYLLQQVLNNPQDTQAGDNYNRFMAKYQNSASSQQGRRNTLGATIGAIGGGLAANTGDVIARYSGSVCKSASFGIIPTNLVHGAQKVARGAANRFGNLSPQINAANVGTAVGAGLGALEGSGINETEEQRRSTGLVGRAGKVLGMTGLGAGVGRGVGSVAGAGVNRYQANQRLQNRRKDNPDAFAKPVAKPRSINVKDEFEE
jgi:hypothetical protein